jgi:hypothetical protein
MATSSFTCSGWSRCREGRQSRNSTLALLQVTLYLLNLPKSTILIVNALQRQQRTENRSNFIFDRPLAK